MSNDVIEYIWRYRGLDVYYHPSVDGDGTYLAPSYVSFIRSHFPQGTHFCTAFEWCAGPGFIGFALLAEELCDRLCIADINPIAIEYTRRTIQFAGLQKQVTAYVSDNLSSVPPEEKFDLVVANPPGFFAINPNHEDYHRLRNDIRAVDPGWQIRAKFYEQIGQHLNSGAFLLIGEVEPFSDKVYCGSQVPRDIRPYPPIQAFREMIRRAGLTYVGEKLLYTEEQMKTWMLISRA